MMCYRSRFHSRDLLTTNDQEVNGQTLGISKGQHILEPSGLLLICVMSSLVNDPYLRIMLHRMKAQTPLVSHKKDNATRNANCRTQCVQGWDHRRLVRRGHLQSRLGRCILTSQLHPPPMAIPHIKQYDKLERIHQMNPPSPRLHQ